MNKKLTPIEKTIVEESYLVAQSAADAAVSDVLKYWQNPLNENRDESLNNEIFEKGSSGKDYATYADKLAEKTIRKFLYESNITKSHVVIGEEDEKKNDNSDFMWFIDPIDGTINFKNGSLAFGIQIGLLFQGKPVIGIIAYPSIGSILSAFNSNIYLKRANGTVLTLPKKTDNNSNLEKLRIGYDVGYDKRVDQLHLVTEKFIDKVSYAVCMGSTAWAHFELATGSLHAYMNRFPKWWDIVAPLAIMNALNFVVTDMSGNEINYSQNPPSYFVSQNKNIHEKLLELMNK